MKIFLAGEGQGELGRWALEPQYRESSSRSDGVLGTLALRLRREQPASIIGAIRWAAIRKYRAGQFRKAEERLVLGCALQALEEGAEALLFSRDSDGDPDRARQIDGALADLAADADFRPLRAAGGVQHPCLEAWVLVLAAAVPNAETLSKAKVLSLAHEHGLQLAPAMAEATERADLDALPASALLLNVWLGRARAVLLPRPGGERS